MNFLLPLTAQPVSRSTAACIVTDVGCNPKSCNVINTTFIFFRGSDKIVVNLELGFLLTPCHKSFQTPVEKEV